MLLQPIVLPALNKWTKVAPCVAHVVLLQTFCGVLPSAFAQAFKHRPQAESEDSEAEANALGAALDRVRARRRLGRKRNLKASAFVQDSHAHWAGWVWLLIAEPVMRVHYHLFRHGTWLTERVNSHGSPIAFCDNRSPAMKVSRELYEFFFNVDQQLGPMVGLFGSFAQWHQHRRRGLRRALFLTLCQLWRKLILPFHDFPWLLFEIFGGGPQIQGEKQRALRDMLAAPECCCDSHFTGRLRKVAPTVETLLQDDELQVFLQAVVLRVVPTSTYIERVFAKVTAWTRRQLTMPGLAAKHATATFKDVEQAWRRRANQERSRSYKRRPSWTSSTVSKGTRVTGLHLFGASLRQEQEPALQILRDTRAQWRNLSREERQKWAHRARMKRAFTAAVNHCHAAAPAFHAAEGPWGASSADEEWPLARHLVASVLSQRRGFATASARWKEVGAGVWG